MGTSFLLFVEGSVWVVALTIADFLSSVAILEVDDEELCFFDILNRVYSLVYHCYLGS